MSLYPHLLCRISSLHGHLMVKKKSQSIFLFVYAKHPYILSHNYFILQKDIAYMLSTLYLKIFPRNPSNHHINYQFLQCNNPTQLPFSPLRLSSNIPHSNPHCLAQIPTLREDQLKCTLPNTAARFRHPKFSATTLR